MFETYALLSRGPRLGDRSKRKQISTICRVAVHSGMHQGLYLIRGDKGNRPWWPNPKSETTCTMTTTIANNASDERVTVVDGGINGEDHVPPDDDL